MKKFLSIILEIKNNILGLWLGFFICAFCSNSPYNMLTLLLICGVSSLIVCTIIVLSILLINKKA